MIIRMAKVEIVGPKQDLLNTLDLLHNRGIFQPDPQLLEQVEIAHEERPKALVLDENELRERSFFLDMQDRITALLALLPESNTALSPMQPLPVMDLLDELATRHLTETRERTQALNECRQDVEDLQRDLTFWQALAPLLEDLPDDSNLELFGITIRDAEQLETLKELLRNNPSQQ